jgi:ABC-type uncharacterized transport system, permease component
MKKYISFFRIRFQNGLQYRAAAYAGIVTQFVWGFMELLMFRAFYHADESAFPMGFSQLASYIWLQQAFLALFMAWFLENDIFSSITSGTIAYELARPMNLYNMWFVKNISSRLSKAVLRCMPILIVAAVLPKPYSLLLAQSPLSFFLFIFTLIIGFLVVVAFCMLVYIATFYTLSPLGVRIIALSLTEFFSGTVIPLPFLPTNVKRIVELTPFASMQNLPFRIYSGNIAGTEMISSILLQILWLIVLIGAGKLWMKRALTKIVVQGG